MSFALPQSEFEGLWREWVAGRNVRGVRLINLLIAGFHPLFWLLDWVVAGPELIWFFGALRLGGVIFAISVIVVVRTEWGQRYHYLLGVLSTYVLVVTLLIMVWALGGTTSAYYAGINLAMIGTGLLFLFGRKGAVAVYGGTVVGWLLLVILATPPGSLPLAIGHTFFIITTAVLVGVGQVFFYSSFRNQVRANYALELTKSSLEKAHDDLKQLDKFKSVVFANITHELKTPLAMILSPLELMLDGKLGRVSDQFRASLQSMYRSAVKLLKMIGDILMLTKLEESRIRLRVDEHDMVEYLESLVRQIKPLAERKKLAVTFESDLETCYAWLDLERIERVFVNLLSNAAKFTPESGRIDVRLMDEGESFCVSVADNGPGFPSAMAERVFERFVQVDSSSTRRQGGTGIGLALSRELVDLHGGRIWAESEPEKGATFYVRLFKAKEHLDPAVLDRRRARAAVPGGRREADRGLGAWSLEREAGDNFRLLDIEEATERRLIERDSDEHRRPHTVLVVEDTPEVIRVVHLSLRQDAKVLAAEDGLKGLELARKHVPSLIITDLMMPGIDGLELTRRLREDELTEHIPIVMLTARGELEDRVVGLETGVNAYLTKPFSPKELVTTVRNLLEVQEKTADILLTQRMDSLETIAGGLAHEINNPLNYVKNALGIIQGSTLKVARLVEQTEGRGPTDAEQARIDKLRSRIEKMFQTAEAGLERIAGTVDAMRQYAREGFARAPRERDIFVAAREVIDIVAPAVGKEVAIECSTEGDGTILCVPEEFNQVLTNLIQNAIEAVDDETGRVVVTGRREGDDVLLSVKDNGPGMTPEVRDRVFTPFFSTKGPGRGMGVGLTIVWRVVHSAGGTVRVETQPGEGAEFIVRVPAAPQLLTGSQVAASSRA